ncbi:hypothetical protein DFJ43DRAFT_1036701 [Lentinula guzmanii]|uniref:Uncharacterized protein n=1 Tax=Lentinula guzmanii TaxID=2804957 RepID=A0AA38JUR7_9AGAR|nr:hypothetical protein DFJ43DRAFT_1036701 [Lentinula guzmanii]
MSIEEQGLLDEILSSNNAPKWYLPQSLIFTNPTNGGINSGHPESPSSTSHLRPRSLSQSSINSFAPSLASLAQTAWVFFRSVKMMKMMKEVKVVVNEEKNVKEKKSHGSRVDDHPMARWARYFRPLTRPVYWRSLTHLVLVNFPFALAAWVYLFVFTVTGTTLLIALPLGAILCFFNLLGAPIHTNKIPQPSSLSSFRPSRRRIFPNNNITTTTTSSSPITHLIATYPIFTRSRHPSASELESGQAVVGEEVTEMSFYKNTYSMFTDPTSFQALFYFLVIKPAITLLFITFFLTICVPLLVLVIPAPVVLRVCRRIGRWQAVVAVEGLVIGVSSRVLYASSSNSDS